MDGSAWCSAAPRPPVPILLNSRVTSHIQFICPCHLSDWSSLLLPPGAVGLGAVVALPPALGLRSALALAALALGSALVFGAGWLRRRLLALVFVASVGAVPESHASSQ